MSDAAHGSGPVPIRLVPRPSVTESAVGTAPPSPPTSDQPVSLTIDGRRLQVKAGQWIIQAAEEAGIYIPRFCYHPRMKPVGMCRMCLVEVSGPRGSTLMPACYNPVAEGMEIQTASPMAKKAQEGVLEFLLVNHPLDCPVCDKGGECPLQDQTLAYGPGESRFVEEKRHWAKPIPISELVYLDRERCIQCGRCVRFADEVAGDPLIDFAERGDLTEVATYPGAPYRSYFSGNVVQICPVGALTAKPYRFKARPWDLEQVESTCTTCSFGCRVAVQSTSGELSRLIGVDSDPVNWGWLCDKGRWAFAAGTSPDRVAVPLIRQGDELVETSWGEALGVAARGLAAAKAGGGGPALAVIGGARLPNEDAYAWAKAARVALATDNVDAQLGDGLPAETVLGLPRATIDQAAAAALVITLAPTSKTSSRSSTCASATRSASAAPRSSSSRRPRPVCPPTRPRPAYRPGEIVALAAAVAGSAPLPEGGRRGRRRHRGRSGPHARAREKSDPDAPSVVVILGRPSLAEPGTRWRRRPAYWRACPAWLFCPPCAGAMCMAPSTWDWRRVFCPAGSHPKPVEPGTSITGGLPLRRPGPATADILEAASRGRIGGLVLLGADPRADFPDAQLAVRGVLGARFVVAVDSHLTASPGGRRGAAGRHLGRAARHLHQPGGPGHLAEPAGHRPAVAWPDWVIASELAARLGVDLGFRASTTSGTRSPGCRPCIRA